jgi:hypothetical protein
MPRVRKHYFLYIKRLKHKNQLPIPVAAPQEPASEAVTATQEPVTPQPEPTTPSVLQENEFLRSELEAYKSRASHGKGSL